MSAAVHPAIRYAPSAASLPPPRPSSRGRITSEECTWPRPAISAGFCRRSRARSPLVTMIAPPPSVTRQQSRSRSGSLIIFERWWSSSVIGSRFCASGLVDACFRHVTAMCPYCRLVMPCSCICRRATWPMNVIAPMSPYGTAYGEPKSIGITPCGLFWQANAQRTVVQKPASIAMTALCTMPIAVAPPMSIVEHNAGVMPRNAATRDAQPCCSPMIAGMSTRTPSIASRSTPQSSIARFAASSVNPIVLVHGSFPKRESPMPAIAQRSRSRTGSGISAAREREHGAAHELALALLVLGPDVAVDQALAVRVVDGGHAATARDRLARPGDLREAGAELAHRPHAAGGDQELPEPAHREHAVREDAGVAGVARELVVRVHGIRVAGGGGVRLQHVAVDGPLHDGRQLGAGRDRARIEGQGHVLREISVLREKNTNAPSASRASVSSTTKSSVPLDPLFS